MMRPISTEELDRRIRRQRTNELSTHMTASKVLLNKEVVQQRGALVLPMSQPANDMILVIVRTPNQNITSLNN
tara:strand:+ start:703 stop:921 length:219 start_codon:yes stop_codon:yes gene_type:complete